jgi:hypothetical protein
MKGIILETNNRHAIVLTKDGCLKRIPVCSKYEQGQEIDIPYQSGSVLINRKKKREKMEQVSKKFRKKFFIKHKENY